MLNICAKMSCRRHATCDVPGSATDPFLIKSNQLNRNEDDDVVCVHE